MKEFVFAGGFLALLFVHGGEIFSSAVGISDQWRSKALGWLLILMEFN
jgi:hypothetical protein